MFEDSLVESGGKLAHRNPWTTTISFAAQTVLLGGILLLSLLYTEGLPLRTMISTLEAPPPPPPAQPVVHNVRAATQVSELHNGQLMVPTRIPQRIVMVRDQPTDTGGNPQPPGVPYGGGSGNSVITELLRENPTPAPAVALQQKVRVSSGVAQGLLIRQVKPQYPPLALQARIQGTVVLQAVIGKDGTVQDLRVVSGHPMLTGAAIDAVKQWRYRPYYLNNEPVSVDTQINVNFTLASQ